MRFEVSFATVPMTPHEQLAPLQAQLLNEALFNSLEAGGQAADEVAAAINDYTRACMGRPREGATVID